MIATHIDSQSPGDAGDRNKFALGVLVSLVNTAHFHN
jgi:hypothetical protein